MTSPYVLPSMLINLAPLGIDWQSIPISGASPQANLAALLDLCFIATDAVDTECFQPLRSTVDVEELVGPGGDRLTLPPSGNGNAMALMQHWPITEALGGQVSPANSFPPQWQALTAAMLWAGQASNQFLGGSSLGSSGSDGMNIVEVQPGYVSWGYGRGGCRLQIAYINGWPTAGLLPAATTSATFTSGNVDATVSSPLPRSGLLLASITGRRCYGPAPWKIRSMWWPRTVAAAPARWRWAAIP